jgi:hypothetical protein
MTVLRIGLLRSLLVHCVNRRIITVSVPSSTFLHQELAERERESCRSKRGCARFLRQIQPATQEESSSSESEEGERERRVVVARFVTTGEMDISGVLLLTTLILTSALARKYIVKEQALFIRQYN